MRERKQTRQRTRLSPRNGTVFRGRLKRHPKNPVVVGTGFLALDIVIPEGSEQCPRTWAGGTCGNVLAILAYLGWRAYPVSRLGMDVGSERIIEDLTQFGVNANFIRRDPHRRTPIVIERIRRTAGQIPRSRFVWTCPGCGAWLPSFQPVLVKDMEAIVASMPDPAVVFFDRVSRGALDLAAAAAKRGALIVFEPSGIRDERLFREALALSHVLKYSHERLSGIPVKIDAERPLIEIETLGAEGLRYRLRGQSASCDWRLMDAYSVGEVRDTVGAGDWCTAGVVHALGARGAVGVMNADATEVESALRLGQALAALTCAYEGARGGMYAMDKRQFRTSIARILDGGSPTSRIERPDVGLQKLWKAVCPECCGERPRQVRAR